MVLIENYSVAILLCILAMFCWGSWQNTRNLAGLSWRFELYYWDFIAGILLFSIIMAFTFGSNGSVGLSFIDDIKQAKADSIVSAMLGGTIWNIGTLFLTAAIALTGMSVAFPIGGGAGWLLGILVLYIAKPEGNPYVLFLGGVIIVGAIMFSVLSYKQLASQQKKTNFKGVFLAILAGVAIAFFYRFVDKSLAINFSNHEGKLSPYTAVVFFSIGAFISTFIYNPFFMKKPVDGKVLMMSDYVNGTFKQHIMGLFGGAIWCMGMSASFMANNAASPAIAYGLSNAAPVVAAIWGIFVWKEFKDAPKKAFSYLKFMFLFYLIGLVLIVISKNL